MFGIDNIFLFHVHAESMLIHISYAKKSDTFAKDRNDYI